MDENGRHFAYIHACLHPSDINEHCPMLYRYAIQCKHITEMGFGSGNSTVAFLDAQPDRLISYDINPVMPLVDAIGAISGRTVFSFHHADVLKVDIEPTDLLFIDTRHTFEQLRQELALHSHKVKKWIILHDTVTFGLIGEDSKLGLLTGVIEFLTRGTFVIKEQFSNNNGLMVLERVKIDGQ
jgi:hypothetical protein